MSTLAAAVLQNRFAPLNLGLHIGFCVFGTLLFLVLYVRQKRLSDIYWMLILDSTLILQFFGDPITAIGVGLCEVLLIVLLVLETLKEKKAAKAAASDADTDMDELDELVKSERKAIMDDNKVDVIGDAFDGEDAVK